MVAATRRFIAGAFFGASPVVASALGATPGATPARLIEHTTGGSGSRSKPELSILLGTGSFYFALTGAKKLGVHRRMVRQALASALPPERKRPEREQPKLAKRAAQTAAQGFASVHPSETEGGEAGIIGLQVGPNEMITGGPNQVDKSKSRSRKPPDSG